MIKKKMKGEVMSEEELSQKTDYTKNYMRSYSFKPNPVFIKSTEEDTNTFFGVEIEKEADDEDCYNEDEIAEEIADKMEKPSLWYTKSDGSLNCGVEVVSHPVSLLAWTMIKDEVGKLFELFYNNNYVSGDYTGLHIHISKKGLDWNKMQKLSEIFHIWNDNNKRGMKQVFQRTTLEYCYMNVELEDSGRYKGFNETQNTFEIRFWGSPSTSKRFYYCLFATAAIALLARKDSKFLAGLLKGTNKTKAYQRVLKFIFITYPEIISKSLDVEIFRPNNVAERTKW